VTLIIHFLAQIIDNGSGTVCFGFLDKITLKTVSYFFYQILLGRDQKICEINSAILLCVRF